MSTGKQMLEVGAVALGCVDLVASWRRPVDKSIAGRYQPMLVIQACGNTDDGVHTPACSVTINSRHALLALRSAIDEALKEPV